MRYTECPSSSSFLFASGHWVPYQQGTGEDNSASTSRLNYALTTSAMMAKK